MDNRLLVRTPAPSGKIELRTNLQANVNASSATNNLCGVHLGGCKVSVMPPRYSTDPETTKSDNAALQQRSRQDSIKKKRFSFCWSKRRHEDDLPLGQ